MGQLRAIPELAALRASRSLVRIPPETDVPVTDRVRRIIDSAAFRRLADISQLGLVRLVYPGAAHSRWEHSLGSYRTALLFLDRLSEGREFERQVDAAAAEKFLVAALLHDVGHWPFCHPIEDLALPDVPSHETFARVLLGEGQIPELLRKDWNLEPEAIGDLLNAASAQPADRILASLLSGPIDVDKMDYLVRDSHHAGVPYGRNFDTQRLVQSLCLDAQGLRLAITDKGKTAAEMMVFARYVMFSEVYWHHAVRAATAMLQRAFFLVYQSLDLERLLRSTEQPVIGALRDQASQLGKGADELLAGLFGSTRRLYKRIRQYSFFQQRQLYQQLARRPYSWLHELCGQLAGRLSVELGRPVSSHEILIDAPPAELEVQFEIDVYFAKEDCYRPLGEISPVVRTLAKEQFDDYVKRVRLFAHPRIADQLRAREDLDQIIAAAVQESTA